MAGYGTNAEFRTYATEAGYVIPDDKTDADLSAARNRAALFIDRYERQFAGQRTLGFTQERAWPRSGASTYYKEAIPDDIVPVPILSASYEAAYLELMTPGLLSPVINQSQAVKREKIGQIEVEYAGVTGTDSDTVIAQLTPIVTTVEGLLWPFMYCSGPVALVI